MSLEILIFRANCLLLDHVLWDSFRLKSFGKLVNKLANWDFSKLI